LWAQINASVQFTRYEVMAPALVEGDSLFVTYQTGGQRADGANGAPAIAAPPHARRPPGRPRSSSPAGSAEMQACKDRIP